MRGVGEGFILNILNLGLKKGHPGEVVHPAVECASGQTGRVAMATEKVGGSFFKMVMEGFSDCNCEGRKGQ